MPNGPRQLLLAPLPFMSFRIPQSVALFLESSEVLRIGMVIGSTNTAPAKFVRISHLNGDVIRSGIDIIRIGICDIVIRRLVVKQVQRIDT